MYQDFERLREVLVAQVLESNGAATPAQRRAAFSSFGLQEPLNTLMYKVAKDSAAIHKEDIEAAKGLGLSEDQIFELIICAAIGEAAQQHHAAMRALNSAADGAS